MRRVALKRVVFEDDGVVFLRERRGTLESVFSLKMLFLILDAWAKPTLGPTQGQYSVIVLIFGAFGRPHSDVRQNRLM